MNVRFLKIIKMNLLTVKEILEAFIILSSFFINSITLDINFVLSPTKAVLSSFTEFFKIIFEITYYIMKINGDFGEYSVFWIIGLADLLANLTIILIGVTNLHTNITKYNLLSDIFLTMIGIEDDIYLWCSLDYSSFKNYLFYSVIALSYMLVMVAVEGIMKYERLKYHPILIAVHFIFRYHSIIISMAAVVQLISLLTIVRYYFDLFRYRLYSVARLNLTKIQRIFLHHDLLCDLAESVMTFFGPAILIIIFAFFQNVVTFSYRFIVVNKSPNYLLDANIYTLLKIVLLHVEFTAIIETVILLTEKVTSRVYICDSLIEFLIVWYLNMFEKKII